MVKADDLFKADKRRYHQGPRVMTLNFEAGYMHAVFPHATTRRFLAARAGSIYAPGKLVQMKCDFSHLEWPAQGQEEESCVRVDSTKSRSLAS